MHQAAVYTISSRCNGQPLTGRRSKEFNIHYSLYRAMPSAKTVAVEPQAKAFKGLIKASARGKKTPEMRRIRSRQQALADAGI